MTLPPQKNPVESGALITDHATLGNLKFRMDCMISEAPIPVGALESLVGIAAGAAGGLIGTAAVGGGLAATGATAIAAFAANKEANFALSKKREKDHRH